MLVYRQLLLLRLRLVIWVMVAIAMGMVIYRWRGYVGMLLPVGLRVWMLVVRMRLSRV